MQKAANAIKRFRTHLRGIGDSAQGLLDDFDGPLYADIDPISNKITELVDLQLRVAEEERNAAWAMYRQAMVITSVLVPVGIAVLMYSAYLGYRSLSAPLAVVGAMDKVTANMDLRVRAPYRHGQLAVSFNRLVTSFNASVDIAEQAGKALADIRSNAERISDMTTQLASAAEEQSTVVEDINRSIVAINGVSGENAAGAEQAIIASQELAQMAVRFQQEASVFEA